MGRIHFSTTLKPVRRYLQQKCSCSYIFTEIANSDLNGVAPIDVNWKKKFWHRAQAVQQILWVVIFFDDSTYEKNTIYRNIKYFAS